MLTSHFGDYYIVVFDNRGDCERIPVTRVVISLVRRAVSRAR